MMKIGWIVWWDLEAKEKGEKPEFWNTEPESWRTSVRIVYAEIEE